MKSILAIVALMGLTSCATILNEDTQRINVTTSNNVKTDIIVNGQTYQAPSILTLDRSEKDLVIKAQNPNCNQDYLLKSKVDNKFWLNILSGGTFGSTTDYSTEEMWTYQDEVELKCRL